MNYCSIRKADIANGKGFRVSLFVSGCGRKCPGCFNAATQDPDYGRPFDDSAKEKVFAELGNEWCRGLSLLGGEPMSVLSDNRKRVIEFAAEVKARYPDKDIWMWTGYTAEELLADKAASEVFKYVDVLVDGPFLEEKKDQSIPFRGSSNQRVIDVRKWRETGKIVEYKV